MGYRLHRSVLVTILLGLFLGTLSWSKPAQAAPEAVPQAAPATPSRYFRETGHNITGAIRTFYETHGDVTIFGLPLTEVVTEGDRDVQYFERARFELHPELAPQYYVTLSHVGRAMAEGRTDGAFAPAAPNGAGAFFPETSHNLFGGFQAFWNKYGGLPVFGYPLSDEFSEQSPTDGVVRTVQYFERARFEYHPDQPIIHQVQLGLLGSQMLDRSSLPVSARNPVARIGLLGEATTAYYGSFAERINNIARGAAEMNGIVVKPGQVFSFNAILGDAGSADGFVEGYAIVNGRLEKVIGGGLCQVATTLYRAVFNAGLDVVERRNHSYVINFYENVAGWDATVFAPYVDFKWRNDTAGPITVYASTNPNKATVTFSLFGSDDGRKVEMIGPTISHRKAQSIPNWQFDPTLKRGQVRQLVHGRPGMDVAMRRVVTAANGNVIHNDNFPSKYRPWEDFFIYGPGVVPPRGVNIVPAAAKPAKASRP